MLLNPLAAELCDRLMADAERLRVGIVRRDDGGVTLDCGVEAAGGLEAGRRLAEVCLAGLGEVSFVPSPRDIWPGLAVAVRTDHPVPACMASQYAGWQVTGKDYFAMASGPMRAAHGKEDLFQRIGHVEQVEAAVGVLEARRLPPDEVCRDIAERAGVWPHRLTLLVAPTASLAGTVQVVARSVETALHKLLELDFDLARVVSGYGVAPLPPVAADDLAGIGRTNDAILYGAEVTLWVRGDDETLREVGPRVPSSASRDHGQPFAAIFDRYDRDFYKIDSHLFSPAVVTLLNVDTGHSFRFGQTLPAVLRKSFGE